MRRMNLEVQEELCWGCRACEVACQQEHALPPSVRPISIFEDGPKWVEGILTTIYRVKVCKHCQDAPCVSSCPEEAIYQRDDGLVILDSEVCIGCGDCLSACPFEAIQVDPSSGRAYKCNLCHKRLDNELLPACTDHICLAHCIRLHAD